MHSSHPLVPAQPTPLVGRTEELAKIKEQVADGQTRLLTLTGPAGVGKTRLALEAAAQLSTVPNRFADGVVVVDLTPTRDPTLALNSIASALGFLDCGNQSLLQRLQQALHDRRLLLILDNFEHVLPAATSLAALLASCPHLTLLVTSRVSLQVRWEHIFHVLPLRVPNLSKPLPPLEELVAIPSIALFLQQAVAHQADFVLTEWQAPLLAHLIAQLDGLPLAIELAAARIATLPLPVIANRLGDRLRFLRWEAPDAPMRQQSLETAVGWSYDLLSEPERHLFRRLGVFVGCVSLDAILAICAEADDAEGNKAEGNKAEGNKSVGEGLMLERLISLATQSLILPWRPTERAWRQEWSSIDSADSADYADAETEPAFGMLETVRVYAEERLAAAGELVSTQRAHAAYFLSLAEQAAPQLRGRDQRRWFLQLDREIHNLRAALRWLLKQNDSTDRAAGLRLAGALGYFWQLRGYHAEGQRWLEMALAPAPQTDDRGNGGAGVSAARMRALLPAGLLLTFCGQFEQAENRLKEALTLAKQLQDAQSVMRSLLYLGVCPAWVGKEAAIPLLREGLSRARVLDEPYYVGVALFYLGMALQAQGHTAEAAACYVEALELFDATGNAHLAAGAHFGLGIILGQRGDLPGAVRHIQVGIGTSVTLRDPWLLTQGAQTALTVLGDRVEPTERARLLGSADALRLATGSGRVVWEREPVDQGWPELREQLTHGESEADYWKGRALRAAEVAALATGMLDELARTLSATASATTVMTAQSPTRAPEAPGPRDDSKRRSECVLTEREREVLRLVAQGLSSKAIGRRLAISSRTVSQHLTSIFNRLGVNTRAHAVAVAAERGLL